MTLEKVYNKLENVENELKRISHLLEEEYELSDHTKKELEKARKRMTSGNVVTEEEARRRLGF